MKSNVVFRPTVVIGLGGTGYGVALKLKKHFIDAYGSVPQAVRFLTFDTTENVEHSERARDGSPVTLEPLTEQHVIQVANPAGLLGGINEHIDSWWPRNIPIGAIIAGAGQVRARGRLALFAKSEEIINSIRATIEEVKLIKVRKQMDRDEFLVSDRGGVEIYVVGSLAGGTGSGMFLDAAFISRSFIDSTSNVTGVLVLPGVFTGKAGVHLVKPNAYGALKELEHFSTLGLDNHFAIEYGQHHRVEVDRPPFDLVYLIDNINERGKGIREAAELQSIIAQGMYLQIGSQIGTNSANTVDNIKTQLATAGRVRNRSAAYCSFGVGTLTLPIRQFESLEVDAARGLLSDGLLAGEFPDGDLEAEVTRFIRDHKLREDEADDVIDALIEQEGGGRIRFPVSIAQITRFDNTAQALIKQLHVTHRSRMEQQVAQRMEVNYKRLLDETASALDAWWEEAINRPNGTTYAARFAQKLASKLEWHQHVMEDEAREEAARLSAVNFRATEEEIQQAAGAWAGRARKVQAACENYRGLINRECEIYVEKARREKAADLYGALRAHVEELGRRCEAMRQKLKAARVILEQQYLDATGARGGESPFEHTLKIDVEQHRPAITPAEFIQWRREHHGSLSGWSVLRDEDLARELAAYVKERYRSLTGLTIEDVLHSIGPDRIGRELAQLDHLSVPLWHYNDARIPLNNRGIITQLYHYGVADAETTVLRQPKVAPRVPRGTTELSFVSTQDPQRIMLFKARVGVPLFALQSIEEMERAYNDPDKVISNHIHRDWEGFPAPIPRAGEGDAMRWFAIAQAPPPLGLISRRGDWYYIRSKKAKKTDAGELRLEQGRIKAYEKFEKDRELVREAEENVDLVMRAEGEAKVSALLRAHIEQLISQVARVSDSTIKEQVEREIEEIEKYLRQVATIR